MVTVSCWLVRVRFRVRVSVRVRFTYMVIYPLVAI